MSKTLIAAAALAVSLSAIPVTAQEEPPVPAPDPAQAAPDAAPPPETAPEADAAPADAAPQAFSDTEVQGFARAVVSIEPIRADPSLDAARKQEMMQEAVIEAGISLETFNAIAAQARTDPALKARVDQEIAALQDQASRA